jgi:hypothetical protein
MKIWTRKIPQIFEEGKINETKECWIGIKGLKKLISGKTGER